MPKRIWLLCLLINLLVKTPLHKKPPGLIPSHNSVFNNSAKNLRLPPPAPLPCSLSKAPPGATLLYQTDSSTTGLAWQSKELGPCHLPLVTHSPGDKGCSVKELELVCHRKPHKSLHEGSCRSQNSGLTGSERGGAQTDRSPKS